MNQQHCRVQEIAGFPLRVFLLNFWGELLLMRIAMVSLRNPRNIRHWSGTLYFMAEQLRMRGHELRIVGPLHTPLEVITKAFFKLANPVRSKHFDASKSPLVVRSQAKLAMRQVDDERFDFLLCPSCIAAGYLDTKIPVVTWEDNAFAGIVGYYPGKWMRYDEVTLANGQYLQQRSLDRAALSVFTSEWAAQSAIENYKVDEQKVRVIPFGANLESPPRAGDVSAALQRRIQTNECRLLFIGVEWLRKGGDLLLETAVLLHERGVKVSVDIVGCSPPGAVPSYVRLHGFVSKASEAGRVTIRQLFLDSHFLFVPSVAECYGLVFAEASAYGVPSLSCETGGIPTVVLNGENGWLLPLGAPAAAYADTIMASLVDVGGYTAMSQRARALYEERFNWQTAIATLETEMARII